VVVVVVVENPSHPNAEEPKTDWTVHPIDLGLYVAGTDPTHYPDTAAEVAAEVEVRSAVAAVVEGPAGTASSGQAPRWTRPGIHPQLPYKQAEPPHSSLLLLTSLPQSEAGGREVAGTALPGSGWTQWQQPERASGWRFGSEVGLRMLAIDRMTIAMIGPWNWALIWTDSGMG
jgi:hypothetical protein